MLGGKVGRGPRRSKSVRVFLQGIFRKKARTMMFITSEIHSVPPHDTHTERHKSREAGCGETIKAQRSGAHPKLNWGAWWACSTARSAGPLRRYVVGGGGG